MYYPNCELVHPHGDGPAIITLKGRANVLAFEEAL
jgi:hypothetical protein